MDLQMSSEIAIKIENVGKCYRIYDQPHHRLTQFVLPRLRQTFGFPLKKNFREFQALNDVSFSIKKGETIGIIGHNGSGKSTLLQMICGTSTPSNGTITTNGRIAALLELGSGFNPDFTGRENVFINGSVLGLSKVEIENRFEKILNFADIGEFIDQPVKVYSSGMMLRLAFAIIAHVDADILVVDEALSVGDAFFTQKCMRFLRAFMDRGTVLFVSHDIAAVKNLCNRAILLDKGTVSMIGTPEDVCNVYLRKDLQEMYGDLVSLSPLGESDQNAIFESINDDEHSVVKYVSELDSVENLSSAAGWNTGICLVTSVNMQKVQDNSSSEFEGGELVRVTICAQAVKDFSDPILGFILKDRLGQELFGENTIPVTKGQSVNVNTGENLRAEFVFRLPTLQNGQYMMMVSLAEGTTENHIHHHYLYDALLINVFSSSIRFGIVGVPFEKVALTIADNVTYS